jgi:hypothetical protein
MSSTSNSRVAPGGMSGGAPRWPSAAPRNDNRSVRGGRVPGAWQAAFGSIC